MTQTDVVKEMERIAAELERDFTEALAALHARMDDLAQEVVTTQGKAGVL